MDSAEDCGEVAVQHKVEEALGRLSEALAAAKQYQDGTLQRKDWT